MGALREVVRPNLKHRLIRCFKCQVQLLGSGGRIRTFNLLVTLIPVLPRSVDYIISRWLIEGVPVSSLYGVPAQVFALEYSSKSAGSGAKIWAGSHGVILQPSLRTPPLSRNFHSGVSAKGCDNSQRAALPLRHSGAQQSKRIFKDFIY